MKNILLIGVGGTGSDAVDILFKKIDELKSNSNNITALVFDTDVGSIERIESATAIPLADTSSVGTICDRVGKEYIREWFPCDDKAIRSQEMIKGASQWRKKSYLAFLNLMNKPKNRAKFTEALERMTVDPNASCEVYVITSVAGGTGSGSFIPIALYAKRYLRKNLGKNPIVNALIALPDIFENSQTPENKVKIYANAYAILRELNAINLVARNYNEGHSLKKKSPVKLRIGHPKEPNVGVLFDASDRKYWTPEAAPFSQIFVIDKMPCVNSPDAHKIVMADSLYSIICTEIGAEFDSEFSNHEILRSQSNGGNAVYASIATSQMRFPLETVLDYLSYQKTLNDCKDEWLYLHNKTEDAIKEKERQAKETRSRFVMKDGEYAKMFLDELKNDAENNEGRISEIVDDCTAHYDKEGKRDGKNTVDIFFENLENVISSKIISTEAKEGEPVYDAIKSLRDDVKKNANIKEDFVEATQAAIQQLTELFKNEIYEIKRMKTSISEAIFVLDKKKDLFANKELSLVENILMNKDLYIHPVAAMTQLCRLRGKLVDALESLGEPWDELKKRDVQELPEWATECKSDVSKKSKYSSYGTQRLMTLGVESDEYVKAKTNVAVDLDYLLADYKHLTEKIQSEAVNQLKLQIFTKLAADVDVLINKYRSFFSRFDKEREDLEEEARTVKKRDSEITDSLINIYSSEKNKDSILSFVDGDSAMVSEEDLRKSNDIGGKGVFTSVYESAVAEVKSSVEWNENNSKAYRSLFKDMIKAYRESIKKGESFKQIASYNVIQAAEVACEENGKDCVAELGKLMSTVLERATPSLKVDMREHFKDTVQPSNVVVFMISWETAKYIKKNAKKYNVRINANGAKESDMIRAAASEFIKKYSGSESARVCIVNTIPDYELYCTGETMDISPLRISKFDELGEDNIYFRHYTNALKSWKQYDTDMWNPHLGNDFHKRGHLPYMNEEMENICDKKMVKALIYAFKRGYVSFGKLAGQSSTDTFKYTNTEGKIVNIRDSEGKDVNMKNIAQLISWIRDLDDSLLDDWSNAFDMFINDEKNKLPNITTEHEIATLEAKITQSAYMEILREKLFKGEKGKDMSLLDFAYKIKTSEETIRDNDDAERVLKVAYETFKDLCAFRANPSTDPERFIKVYRQQLRKTFESLLSFESLQNAGKDCEAYFDQFVSWLFYADTFKDIDVNNAMVNGEVDISAKYKLDDGDKDSDEIKAKIDKIKKTPQKFYGKQVTEDTGNGDASNN